MPLSPHKLRAPCRQHCVFICFFAAGISQSRCTDPCRHRCQAVASMHAGMTLPFLTSSLKGTGKRRMAGSEDKRGGQSLWGDLGTRFWSPALHCDDKRAEEGTRRWSAVTPCLSPADLGTETANTDPASLQLPLPLSLVLRTACKRPPHMVRVPRAGAM